MKKWLLATALAGALLLPQQAEATEQAFKDVTDARQNHILLKLVSKDILDRDQYFLPATGMTRAEMADVISRAYKLYTKRPATEFADVPTDHEHYDAIQALYQAGIVDGNEGNFNPDGIVKRAHVAKVLTNLLSLTPKQTTAFKDVPLTDANNTYVGALVQKGLTTGFEDGTFRPNQHVTKVQFATFVYRALYGKEPDLKTRQIGSNLDFAPTKISAANYNIPFLETGSQTYIKYDKNGFGQSNGADGYPILVTFNKSSIMIGLDGSDFIFYNVDLRGLTEFKESKGVDYEYDWDNTYEHPYTATVSFDETVKTSKLTIQGATKITHYYSKDDRRVEYYFKEGFGLIKQLTDRETMWELTSYKLR
ncbi:S-layer homology domain-containing protein [Caryophanon latum]|uniref:SLH domain-containing protein n=1 Tax=Caryophanon latum TaxID=33977 RepID=A0A1C0Z4G3_9BACL|nr:S-layer homology domain-containing protein [Caryophanon latum]OCS94283.1 hypothetical protein A6K76_04225 [Caryophanon latum]